MLANHINMGGFDRAFRAFVIGPAAIIAAVSIGAASIVAIPLFVVAGIALVTAATGFCPAYIPLGIDTRGRTPLPH